LGQSRLCKGGAVVGKKKWSKPGASNGNENTFTGRGGLREHSCHYKKTKGKSFLRIARRYYLLKQTWGRKRQLVGRSLPGPKDLVEKKKVSHPCPNLLGGGTGSELKIPDVFGRGDEG